VLADPPEVDPSRWDWSRRVAPTLEVIARAAGLDTKRKTGEVAA
jgi:hypothetical protein